MKAKLIAVASVFALGIAMSASASADCAYPKSPESAPNGATATESEMVAGMQAFKKYNDEMTAYLSCLDAQTNNSITQAGDKPDQVKQIKKMADKKHDAAIDELQTHADAFNSQLRAFKAKSKG